jgi:hypothetical protein
MKRMKNMTNQGGPNPGDNPKPDIRPPDEDPNPERKEPEPSEQPGNPNPDGQPNEIRATDVDYRYKGGRQGVGEVPNPREVREAAEKYRGTANQIAGHDKEAVHGDGQNRAEHLNGQTRNPE